jgi:hypothetical protein
VCRGDDGPRQSLVLLASTPAPIRRRPRCTRRPACRAASAAVELATWAGMTQPALSRLEAGGVIPTIPLLDRISAALDADLIVEIAPHAA